MTSYNLQKMLDEIDQLPKLVDFPYASLSRSSNGSCSLVSVDHVHQRLVYRRGGKDQGIVTQQLKKLVLALSDREPVEINSVFEGSGNFRSALEAIVARTPNVYLCEIQGKKHLFWDPEEGHALGVIVKKEPPKIDVGPKKILQALALIKPFSAHYDASDHDSCIGWLNRIENDLTGGVVVEDFSLRTFAAKVFSFLYDNEDRLKRIFDKVELYNTQDDLFCRERLKIKDDGKKVYLTGLFAHVSEEGVKVLNQKGAKNHDRWYEQKVFEGRGGPNYISLEWSFKEFKEDKPDVRLSLSFPCLRRLIEWLYPDYTIDDRTNDDDDAPYRMRRLANKTRTIDKLAIALREFKAHRNDPEWRGERGENDWTSCSVNTATREYYSKIDEAAVLAFDEAKFTELFCGVKDAQGKLVFSPMWSGCIGQGWPHIKKAYDHDRTGVLKFIADIAASDKCAKEFCNKDFQRPGGFGKSVISELLMKFHPDSCIKYGSKTGDVFKFLGLVSKDYKPDYDAAEYNKAYELATDIRDRMSKLEITQTLDNDLDPDYLTVNEFVGWVFDNKEMLQEKFREPPVEEDKLVDRLSAALKCFQRGRAEKGRDGWESWDAWAVAARTEFSRADAAMFLADGFDYAHFMQKFVYNPTVANTKFLRHTDEEKTAVGNFIAQERANPHATSWYLDESHRPDAKGMGPGVMLNFMMKVRPDEFCTYSEMLHRMLTFVDLTNEPYTDKITIASYEAVKSLQGIVLARMHELGIGKTAADPSPADYLTVNEFAWWLSDEKNQNFIKEKINAMELKPVNSKATVKKGGKKLSEAFAGDEMLKRLAAALRTKPFAILAGHSGTGKSQLVRRLAYMTCNNSKLVAEGEGKTAPGNYCMVQVKPNWHDSTDLLGYYSDLGTRHFVNTAFVQFLCKAYAYPETPFFLCLDEMNLAPVEQYFAEYLSAVESLEKKGEIWVSDPLVEVTKTGEQDADGNFKVDEDILGQIMRGAQSTEAADWIRRHGVTIPKNLFVVGTVNMDETTCQFSRKVLDRAMTLLMNEVKFADMGKAKEPSTEELLDENGIAFFMEGERRGRVGTTEAGLLDGLNKALVNTPFVVAYRFANEYALYEEAWANLGGLAKLSAGATEAEKNSYWTKVSGSSADALDHVVLMKLLPRIHGMKDVVKGIFEGRKVDGKDIPGIRSVVKVEGLCATMMTEILKRGDEYLTFWP